MYRSGVWWLKVPHLQPRSVKGPNISPQQLSIIIFMWYYYLVAATISTYRHHYQAREITDMRLLNTRTHKERVCWLKPSTLCDSQPHMGRRGGESERYRK